jgi:hypothetical protein
MNWEIPKLSKQDIELLTITLDDYMYYAEKDGIDTIEVEKLLIRLNDHLQNY